MHAELLVDLSKLIGFLLILARVSGVIVMVPIPGLSAGTETSRIVLALVLTAALYPVCPQLSTAAPTLVHVTGWIAAECAFGLTLGVAAAFLLEGLQMAAQMIGLQAGYSFASTIDPSTQADTTTLQLMAQLLAGSFFFAFGLEREIIKALARGLQSSPPGSYTLDPRSAQAIAGLASSIFSTGLRLAFPVLALTILLDVAFAVLGRLQGQLQLLSLAFSAKMLVALMFLATLLSGYPAVFRQSARAMFDLVLEVLIR